MILYHGSTVEVTQPSIKKCKQGKDFGRGFYTTTNKEQAEKFARSVSTKKGYIHGVVSAFELQDINGLAIYKFDATNRDWINCVIGNRYGQYKRLAYKWNSYDIIIGKVADDDTSGVISAYMGGFFGVTGSDEAIKLAIRRFMTNKLTDQICFRAAKSIQRLSFIVSVVV